MARADLVPDLPSRRPRISWLKAAAIAVALLGFAFVAQIGPTLSLSLALALPGAESWLAPFLDEVVVEELSVEVEGQRLVSDLYRPTAPRGALLLVHGLSRAGRRHPELVRLARLLARHGWLVLVPQFEGLAAFRLHGREIAEVRAALEALAARSASVGIAGFSFGAGPALLAAADFPDLVLTASFGGYADLRGVIVYLTTGAHEFAGRRYVQQPEEYNRWKLLALLVGFVEDERDHRLLDRIAQRRLADPGIDTRGLEADLGPEGKGVLALVLNRRQDAVGPLLAALPTGARAAIAQLSPLAAVPRLPGRLLIAHGVGDASIPFTESLRLAEASQGRAAAMILETFEHTRAQPLWQSTASRVRDGLRLLRLAHLLLEARSTRPHASSTFASSRSPRQLAAMSLAPSGKLRCPCTPPAMSVPERAKRCGSPRSAVSRRISRTARGAFRATCSATLTRTTCPSAPDP
jgi:acetyl esterase/lipase